MYKALAVGVILANGVMFGRVLLELFVLNRSLFLSLLPIMAVLILVTGLASYLLLKRAQNISEKIKLKSPFTLKPALKFAGIFALVLALLKFAEIYVSSSKGVYLVSFLSGLADVDAITVSLAQAAGNTISYETAAQRHSSRRVDKHCHERVHCFCASEKKIQQHSAGHFFASHRHRAGTGISVIRYWKNINGTKNG